MPEGVPGELFVGGAGVARGYLRATGADRGAVSPESVRRRDGSIAPATAPDTVGGELLYLGRADDQVKIRGFRIELGEIEAVLPEHPTSQRQRRRSSARTRRATSGSSRTSCPEHGTTPAPAPTSSARTLEARLPAFMVPSAFVVVETPSAHRQRQARPRGSARRQTDARSTRPGSWLRQPRPSGAIAEIWQEILGLETVGATDAHFFHLGGHSLLAARVVSGAAGEFGIELSVRAIFEHPVLSRCPGTSMPNAHARTLRVGRRRGGGRRLPAGVQPDRDRVPTVVPAAQLLFLDDLSQGGATYNAALAFRVSAARLDPRRPDPCAGRPRRSTRGASHRPPGRARGADAGRARRVAARRSGRRGARMATIDEALLEHARRPFDLDGVI